MALFLLQAFSPRIQEVLDLFLGELVCMRQQSYLLEHSWHLVRNFVYYQRILGCIDHSHKFLWIFRRCQYQGQLWSQQVQMACLSHLVWRRLVSSRRLLVGYHCWLVWVRWSRLIYLQGSSIWWVFLFCSFQVLTLQLILWNIRKIVRPICQVLRRLAQINHEFPHPDDLGIACGSNFCLRRSLVAKSFSLLILVKHEVAQSHFWRFLFAPVWCETLSCDPL